MEKEGIDDEHVVMTTTKVGDNFFGVLRTPEEIRDSMNLAKKTHEEGKSSRREVDVSKKGSKSKVLITNCFIFPEKTSDITMSNVLDFFDQIIFWAYCSLIEQGYKRITIKQIWSLMTGKNKSRAAPSSAMARQIQESLDNMRHTRVWFDWTAQAEAYGFDTKNIVTVIKETNLVYADKTTVNYENGTEAVAYEPKATPELFNYAKLINQRITFKDDVLNIGIQATKRNITILWFLLRRILQFKRSPRRMSPTIRFDTLFRECHLDVKSRKTEKVIKDEVFKILDCFKETDLIKGYEKKIGARGKIISVTIKAKPQPEKEKNGNKAETQINGNRGTDV